MDNDGLWFARTHKSTHKHNNLTSSQMLCTPFANNIDERFLICAKLALPSSVQVLWKQTGTCTETPCVVIWTHRQSSGSRDGLLLCQNRKENLCSSSNCFGFYKRVLDFGLL